MSEIYRNDRLDDVLLADYRKARKAFLEGDTLRADQLYSANRRHHAIDLYYEVDLPEHVMFVHPLGTVLGRATYGDYLCVYNGVNVGSTVDRNYPVLGTGVVLFPGAKVLGKSVLGNNVWVTANTVILDQVVPNNVVVFMDIMVHAGVGKDVNTPVFEFSANWKRTERNVKRDMFGT